MFNERFLLKCSHNKKFWLSKHLYCCCPKSLWATTIFCRSCPLYGKLESPSSLPTVALYQVWLKLAQLLNFFNVFCFVIISRWKSGPLFGKLESPSPKDALCKLWLKLTNWLLRRFLYFVNVFSLFLNYLLMEKDVTLYLNKFESLSSKDDLFQVWLNLALWFWKRRWKCEKFTDRRAMDDTRSEKLTWAFSTEDLKYQIGLILWRIHQIIVVLVVYSFQK